MKLRQLREVMDVETKVAIFRIEGRHFNRRAGTAIRMADSRVYSFPVHGQRQNAVMIAVDELGNPAMWFRSTCRSFENLRWAPHTETEIVLGPDQPMSPEIVCIAVVASPLLLNYFQRSGGG
jgi:hypothetical protein